MDSPEDDLLICRRIRKRPKLDPRVAIWFPTPPSSSNRNGSRGRAAPPSTSNALAPLLHGQRKAAFLTLVNLDPVVRAFHAHDPCCRVSDNYLTAMTFVYFDRANLKPDEINRYNFFLSLYLAHDVHEESEEKWEILPWALGRDWKVRIGTFHKDRLELLSRMGFRACVAKVCCEQVFSMFSGLEAFGRLRDVAHGGDLRRRPRDGTDKARYVPFGPVWHHWDHGNLMWKRRRSDKKPLGKPCRVCGRRPRLTPKFKKLCEEAKGEDSKQPTEDLSQTYLDYSASEGEGSGGSSPAPPAGSQALSFTSGSSGMFNRSFFGVSNAVTHIEELLELESQSDKIKGIWSS